MLLYGSEVRVVSIHCEEIVPNTFRPHLRPIPVLNTRVAPDRPLTGWRSDCPDVKGPQNNESPWHNDITNHLRVS
jgi:hypothetical protein